MTVSEPRPLSLGLCCRQLFIDMLQVAVLVFIPCYFARERTLRHDGNVSHLTIAGVENPAVGLTIWNGQPQPSDLLT
jgi:hypothetical protein